MDKKQVLHLTLKREPFDAMARGEKNEEFRENKRYWSKRIADKNYDEVWLCNGYDPSKHPFMRREYRGYDFRAVDGEMMFVLNLGRILELKNWHGGNCGTCGHRHELPGFDPIWCDHLNRWTAKKARTCGAWIAPQPQAIVRITRDGYTLQVCDGVHESIEKWIRFCGLMERDTGDIEKAGLPEQLTFAMMCLAAEAEHVCRTLPDAAPAATATALKEAS